MEIMNARIQIEHLLPAWEIFRRTTDIAPIRDEAHYRQMVAILEALLDESSGNENHPAMGLSPGPGARRTLRGLARHLCVRLPQGQTPISALKSKPPQACRRR